MLINRLVSRALRGAVGAAMVIPMAVAVAVVAPQAPASADPPRADLALADLRLTPGVTVPGRTLTLQVGVDNRGAATSDPITLTVTHPDRVSPASVLNDPGSEWECGHADRTWTCQHPALAAGQSTLDLFFDSVADAAVPGDSLTFDIAVAPSKQESNLINNVAQRRTDIFDFGAIRGTVWIDSNRDGQRTPDEPVVSGDTPGLLQFFISPQNVDDGHPGAAPVIQPDGTYTATVEPGSYVVVMALDRTVLSFTRGDVGDDVTDSDLVDFQVEPGVVAGLSAIIDVRGDEQVVDIGLVSTG